MEVDKRVEALISMLIGLSIAGAILKDYGQTAISDVLDAFSALANLTDASANPYPGVALFSVFGIIIVYGLFKYFWNAFTKIGD